MKRFLISLCLLVAVVAALDTTANAQLKPMTDTSQTKNIEELVDRYFISLNDPDDKRRRELIKQVWRRKASLVLYGLPRPMAWMLSTSLRKEI